MVRITFETLEQLKSFLEKNHYDDVKYMVNPDYIDAIVGLTCEGKLVYDYLKMVKHLAEIYEANGNTEDPDIEAAEWIDYNCDMPYWEIVTMDDGWWYDELDDEDIKPFSKYFIGINSHSALLIDSDLIDIDKCDISGLEEILKSRQIEYKVV